VEESNAPELAPLQAPPLIHPVSDFAAYPRQTVEKELKRSIRYVRGFVIGNYWMGAATATLLGIAGLAGAFSDSYQSRSSDSDVGAILATLFFSIFFLVGFCIGVYSRRKRVSVFLALIASFFAGIMWLVAFAHYHPLGATCLLFVYTAIGLTAAIFVNRAAKQLEGPPVVG
jgi:hypothetical protein